MTTEQLRLALSATQSAVETVRKSAKSFLRQCEFQPNFATGLLHAATTAQTGWDSDMQLLALLYFKNHAVRHWSGLHEGITIIMSSRESRPPTTYGRTGRALGKSQSSQYVWTLHSVQSGARRESGGVSGTCHCACLCSGSRLDPLVPAITINLQSKSEEKEAMLAQLLPMTVLQGLSNQSTLAQAVRILRVYKPLIKTWYHRAVRIEPPPPQNHELLLQRSADLLQFLLPIFNALAAALSPQSPATPELLESLRIASVCLRDTLRSIQSNSDDALLVVQRLFGLLECVSSQPAVQSKTVNSIAKCLVTTLQHHPMAFVGVSGELLPRYLDFVVSKFQDLVLRGPCMSVLAAVLSSASYQINPTKNSARTQDNQRFAVAVARLLTEYFTASRVAELCR